MAREFDVVEWIFEIGARGLKPDPDLMVSEWADTYRVLTSVSSPEPGPWKTSRVPFMEEIMNALSANSPYQMVVFMKGSQIAGTEGGLNWIGYVIDQAPGPMLYVLPTEQVAKDYSKTRIDPLIEESPALRGKVKEARSRDSGNTTLLKEFVGGYLSLIGANSGAALRGKPIRYLFVDELDAFPGNINGEGDPFNLAVVRTRNFGRRKKIFANSSPKVKGRSRIESLYDKTDKRRYFVPCPECARMQYLRWGQIKWDKTVPVDKQHETAYYECESCETKIFNHQKTEMLARGKWRGTRNDSPANVAGFHLSALYSPVGWMSWQDCVRQFLDSKHDRELLRVFVNTVLGETFEERGDAPEWERLYHRREKYSLNRLPRRALVMTAGVDVQKDRLEAQLVGWGRGLESWIIDYRVFPGDPIQAAVWQRLDELLMETFEHESGLFVPLRMLAIDSSYETQAVYKWARRYPISRVMAVKGQDSLSAIIGQPRVKDVNIDGRKVRRGVKMTQVGVSMLKEELYGKLRLPAPEPKEAPMPGYIHFPEDLTEEYFKQLTSEHLVPIRQRTGTKYEWNILDGRRNEALDTWVYARAAAAALGIDRWPESVWRGLETSFPGAGEAPPPSGNNPPPAPQSQPSSGPRRGRRVFSKGASL